MDIKSKNYHKLAAVIIALVILLPSLAMMFIRPHYISQQKENGQISYSNTDLMDQLVKDTYAPLCRRIPEGTWKQPDSF